MGSQIFNVDSQIDSTTCKIVSMDTKTGEFKVSYDGPQFTCTIEDELYIGHSKRRVNEPIIQRLVHGLKKVYLDYQKQGICYLITIGSDNTSEITISIIVDNQDGYDDKELQEIRKDFMEVMHATYSEFFQSCNDGVDLAFAEQNAFDFMCKRIEFIKKPKKSHANEKVTTTRRVEDDGTEARGGFETNPDDISYLAEELNNNTSNASMAEKATYMMTVANVIAKSSHG